MDQDQFKQEMAAIKAAQDDLASRKASLRKEVILQINEYVKLLDIRPGEVKFAETDGGEPEPAQQPKESPKRRVAPKYATPDGSACWSGRGRMPVKFRELVDAGVPLESLLINDPAK